MAQYKTKQEAFWAGEFGGEYLQRNRGEDLVAANLAFFSKVLSSTASISSVIEFGSNIGLNLMALKQLLPRASFSAIEINSKAAEQLKKLENVKVYNQSLFDFVPDSTRNFVFAKGVLIHLNPDMLPKAYDLLYQTSNRYILVSEYYNPVPVAVDYRGHSDVMFKRDFAGEIMDRHPDMKLINYGFNYHRDPNFTYGDGSWFLMEKQSA